MTVKARIRAWASPLVHDLMIMARPPKGQAPDIVVRDDSGSTVVDDYWNRHTLHPRRFVTAAESERHLKWRNAMYPNFLEMMDLYGDHTGETVLDYGCGPGEDVTGFLLWSNAKKVIAMDVSGKALYQLRHRLALHEVDLQRIELVRITDAVGRIPLDDASIDWLHCGGVLHHTTHPHEIVKEFARVMKPGAQGRLMLYNRDSVMYHLYIAYARLMVDKAFPGLTVDQAFTKSTDGPDCPVSDAWAPERVLDMIRGAGLEGDFRGGYVAADEVAWVEKYRDAAMRDANLADEHRQFVADLTFDGKGQPMWHGRYAGIGGVYTIRKAS
jgi:ubiquinone/menaquinone biosynthesis C-methylase UbiE